MGSPRRPTPEDQQRWDALAARPGEQRNPVCTVYLANGPLEGPREANALTLALVFEDAGERHRYIRSGAKTFDYVGSTPSRRSGLGT